MPRKRKKTKKNLRKKLKKSKKTRKSSKKKRFKKRSLRRRRIGKSKKKQKKIKQLTRRKKVRSKKTKRRKSFFKKAKTSGFKKSIKKRFSLKKIFLNILSPLVNKIRNYQKKRQLLKSQKIKEEERRRQKEIRAQSDLRKELLKKEIREEKVIARTRKIELHSFLRKEQKNIREKEIKKQSKFLEEVRLEKTLQRFRARELEEIQSIERYALNIEKEDYKDFQRRIDNVRAKYKALANERLRKRVIELGVTLSDQASVKEIRQKEKAYIERRELIETSLESFIRSATSLVYQINKKYLPRNADLIRVMNLVYEQGEIIIKEDQMQNDFLILIYVKNQDSKKEIIVEDKIKNETREYTPTAIFKFGDDLTDSLILYLTRLRQPLEKTKKAS